MMKASQSTLISIISAVVVIACMAMNAPFVMAQNCSIPPENQDPNAVVIELTSGMSETHYRVVSAPFQGIVTPENLNITGIVVQGTGMETLHITLADDVRGGLNTDVYTALVWQIYPSPTDPLINTGIDIDFLLPTDDVAGVFLLLTVDPTPTAPFPACYTETLTFQEPDTTPPRLLGVTHIDNLEGADTLILDFDEPLGTFDLTSLSIGRVNNCQRNVTDTSLDGEVVTLTITPGRRRHATACDLATLVAGNTLQLDAAATSDRWGNLLAESNDSAIYPGSGEVWDIEGQEIISPQVGTFSRGERGKYASALRALITSLEQKLHQDSRLQATLQRGLTSRQPWSKRPAAELQGMLQHFQHEFQRFLQEPRL